MISAADMVVGAKLSQFLFLTASRCVMTQNDSIEDARIKINRVIPSVSAGSHPLD